MMDFMSYAVDLSVEGRVFPEPVLLAFKGALFAGARAGEVLAGGGAGPLFDLAGFHKQNFYVLHGTSCFS